MSQVAWASLTLGVIMFVAGRSESSIREAGFILFLGGAILGLAASKYT